MAPIISPRNIARELVAELDRRSPFHSTPRTSPRSSFSSSTLRSTTARLLPRLAEDVDTVPEGYGKYQSGPDAGTVVGITLGSIAGFLLLLWLIYSCVNIGNNKNKGVIETTSVGNASEVTRKSRKHRRRSHHSRSPRRETVEIRRERERVVPVPMTGTERIVVEERSRSRAPPPPMPAPPPPRPVMDDDDEVVVIEENTPPRRRESKHKRRSTERRSSGYREVDPYRYAGGDEPMRDMSRRRSDSRRR
ncbi:hypothetical protein BJ170DRAFT_252205 [Xylariales sp. AK1849]|nr:hypothetical protein BJ170DRAFT_252205 [Xylariales sp. AK1849]